MRDQFVGDIRLARGGVRGCRGAGPKSQRCQSKPGEPGEPGSAPELGERLGSRQALGGPAGTRTEQLQIKYHVHYIYFRTNNSIMK